MLTENQERHIRNSQIEQVVVGGCMQDRLFDDHNTNGDISQHSSHKYYSIYYWN